MRLLIILLWCVGCAPAAAPVAVPGPAPAPTPASAAVIAVGVLRESNNARRAQGLEPLVGDAALDRAALGHAMELAALRRLDHASAVPGRETMTARIEAAGGTWTAAAENLASLNGSATLVPIRSIEMWLGSPGHRRNLLDPRYTHSGVGVAPDHTGQWYIVQLYTVPRRTR